VGLGLVALVVACSLPDISAIETKARRHIESSTRSVQHATNSEGRDTSKHVL
jgi:hypothetical protein